ncbi:facilitated trehalose transporter Tret1-2 homolog isoform X2 [Zootermopsis nevadensis]|uniref:facilitated trehalose transporter Tret1-2 homolog isoform X2 n=1 Tax=Zootermopsis nevadensis TaxID=136037 RepID=UPI000B8E72CC|nr:facilitated trehalose transporter Tret1-2 homolog isoform X2 [Zootermopsis nevadensis]
MDPVSLQEETKPWLESTGNHDIQLAKPKTYEVVSSRISVVYKPTTQETPPVLPQIFAAISAGSFHVVVGFSLAYSAILIPQLEAPDSDLEIDKENTPWLASVLVLVVPVGAILAGFIMEYAGRLNTIKIAAVPCLIGWCLIAIGSNFTTVLCGRLLTGVAAGMGTSPAIVYITEVAKPELRGALIATCPTLASFGMMLSYLKGAYLTWRTAAWTSVIYVLIPLLLITIWIPESPVWLVARGRVDEAENSLKWLAGEKSSLPEQQLAALVKSQDMKALVTSGFMGRLAGFGRPSGYKPLLVLTGLFFFQQFSGVYTTLFYSVELFKDVGSSMDPSMATILVGLMRLIMSFFNTALLRRFGRRPLCMISACGMAVCLIVSGWTTWYILDGGDGISWLPVVCVLLYVCSSMIGLLSIPWTMTAELFPTEIRGLAHGVTISIAHILMFVSIQCYRDVRDLLGGAHALQWFFAAVALGGVVFIYVFLPETHGKTLAEIEEYFKENTIYIRRKKPVQRTENGAPSGEMVMITSKA